MVCVNISRNIAWIVSLILHPFSTDWGLLAHTGVYLGHLSLPGILNGKEKKKQLAFAFC